MRLINTGWYGYDDGMAGTPPTPLLEDAIDVPLWLIDDRETAFAERARRDRALGLAITVRTPLGRVRRWWRALDAPERPCQGARFTRARSLATFALTVTAALFGAGLALAVLSYEGRYPVNVVTALALLVGVPFSLMCLAALLMLGHIPGLGGLQRTLAALNIGNLAGRMTMRLVRDGGSAEVLVAGWRRGHGGPVARFSRWQLIVWSQWAGLTFSAAALATCFALVVFTDLAFGWSTTLDVSAGDARHIVNVVSWPWAELAPDAVPTLELIEESRYFRLKGTDTVASPAQLTGWWPFLLMAMIVYGILPRAALLALAFIRLNAATRSLLLDHPEVRALLDRMNATVVDLDGGEPETPPAASPSARRLSRVPRFAAGTLAISWNDALSTAGAPLKDQLTDGRCLDAGGARSLADDEALLAAVEPGRATAIVVFTKAWEPPLLDLEDFLQKLRQRIGKGTSIVVVPLGINGGAPSAEEMAAWDHGVSRIGDPELYVHEATA